MALKTFVKVSGVNNLSDARYCAGMGVDILGFNLNLGDEAHIPKEKFEEITGWVTGVQTSGEFGPAEPSVIQQVIGKYPIDYIEFSRPEFARELSTFGKALALRLDVSNTAVDDMAAAMGFADDFCDYFVLESSKDKLEEKQLKLIEGLARKYPVILGFGINAENIGVLLERIPLKGISIQGGHEIKPGLKDYGELADILEALEVDDQA